VIKSKKTVAFIGQMGYNEAVSNATGIHWGECKAQLEAQEEKSKMKNHKQHFRTIPAALSLLIFLGSTVGNGFPLSAHKSRVNAAESTAQPFPYEQVLQNRDVSFAATKQSVQQVQHLADALYDENLAYFSANSGGFSWDTERKSRSWTYYNGIMMDAYLMMDDCLQTENGDFYDAVNDFYDVNISYDDSVASLNTNGSKDNYYRENELDSIPPLRAMFDLLRSDLPTEEEREKYIAMILYVYDLMTNSYPTVDGTDGNFKHKHGNVSSSWNTYPIALDGLYMAQPFFMEVANAVEDGSLHGADAEIVPDQIYEEVAARMLWVGEQFYDAETGLYHHGWGPQAGLNGQFWLRAVGWYAAALADVISMLPERFETQRNQLIAIETQLFDGMLQYQDAETGLWYNVINHDDTLKGSTSVNLPESSGSALIAYAMLRSYAEGYMDSTYCEAGLCAFNGTIQTQLQEDGLQNIYISSSVCTSPENYLDKSYKVNEAKGVGPLMMAACFAQKAAERYYGSTEGICGAQGEHMQWNWSADHQSVLVISGNGMMCDCTENSPFAHCRRWVKSVVVEDGAESIGAGAFSGFTKLIAVVIPGSVTTIAEDAFNGCDNFTVFGDPGTAAEAFANTHNIPFVSLKEALGDINADGAFLMSDIVLLQKWLLAVPDVYLLNPYAADANGDEKLDVCDLTLLKRQLLLQS